MPNATLDNWTTDDDSTTYGRSPLFPKSRAGCAPAPRPAAKMNRLEAYALRNVSDRDPEFSGFLLQFLRDFNAALHKPITIPGLSRRTSSVKKEETTEAFRVPPFTVGMDKDEAEILAELDVEAAVASLTSAPAPAPVTATITSRPLPRRRGR